MRRREIVIVLSICAMLLQTGCLERQEYREMLSRAETLVDEHPDSALTVLDSLEQHRADFGKSFLMRYRLHRLNTLNKMDSAFRSTDEAKTLANYFEDHGTPNEQMLAYYLLGRAYHDTHEAPMALNSYQKAAERADTTAKDCNYRQLSRVYGQMSEVFYQQGLYEQDIRHIDLSVKYGWMGKDTLNALRSMAGKIIAYQMQMETDSAIYIWKEVTRLFSRYGYKQYAAAYAITFLRDLIDRGETEKVRRLINTYESESGFFDSNHNISKGREVYYYTKGYYYLAINKNDSAEYYFRKELREAKDFNNQNAGSRGLALLYKKLHQPDSATKYALYSYEMNDSFYAQRATKEVEQTKGMYDYTRNQEIAQQEKEKAEKEREVARTILGIFVLFVLTILYVARLLYKKRKREKEAYLQKVSDLAKAQTDIAKLCSLAEHSEELNLLIEEKQAEISKMADDIKSYKERLGSQKKTAEAQLQESIFYGELLKKAGKAEELTNEDWHQVNMLAIETLPNFYSFISSKKLELNDKEFKTCLLIRMYFTPKDIANMLGVSQAYITKMRNNMMPKLFGEEGNSKDLDERLLQYS